MNLTDLNILYKYKSKDDPNWVRMSIILGKFAENVNSQDNTSEDICKVIQFLIDVGYEYNVDLNKAWNKWQNKAIHKVYLNH